jgi:opacity protein-like surface antigen
MKVLVIFGLMALGFASVIDAAEPSRLSLGLGVSVAAASGYDVGDLAGNMTWEMPWRRGLDLRAAVGWSGKLGRPAPDGPKRVSFEAVSVGLLFHLAERGKLMPFGHAGLAVVRTTARYQVPSECGCSLWDSRSEHAIGAGLVAGAGVELRLGENGDALALGVEGLLPAGDMPGWKGHSKPWAISALATGKFRL